MVFFFYLGIIIALAYIQSELQYKVVDVMCTILLICVVFDGFFTKLLKKYVLDQLLSL